MRSCFDAFILIQILQTLIQFKVLCGKKSSNHLFGLSWENPSFVIWNDSHSGAIHFFSFFCWMEFNQRWFGPNVNHPSKTTSFVKWNLSMQMYAYSFLWCFELYCTQSMWPFRKDAHKKCFLVVEPLRSGYPPPPYLSGLYLYRQFFPLMIKCGFLLVVRGVLVVRLL